jgi:hypothetical protein
VLVMSLCMLTTVSFACSDPSPNACELHENIGSLEKQKEVLTQEVARTNFSLKAKHQELDQLQQTIGITQQIVNGKQPVYILRLSIRQVSYTLDIKKQLRDAINEFEFTIPVNEHYYRQVQEGQNLSDEFRWGSLIFRSSFGKWRIRVKEKLIQYT